MSVAAAPQPPAAPGEGRRLLRNSTLLGAGELASTVLGFLTTLLITDRLGTEYGRLVGAQKLVGFWLVLGQFGLLPLLVRNVAARRAPPGALLGTALALRLPLGLLFAGSVVLFARSSSYLPESHWLLHAWVAIELVGLVTETFIGVLEGRESMGASALISSTRALVVFLGLGVVMLLGAGLPGIVLAYLASRVAQLGVAIGMIRRAGPGLRLRFERTLVLPMLREALPFVGVSLCFMAMTSLDVMLLTLRSTTEQTAYYGAALPFFDVLLVVPAFVQRALLPAFARLRSDARGDDVASQTLQAFGAVLLPAAVGLSLVAPRAMELFPSGHFDAAAPALRVLAIAGWASGLGIVAAAWLTGAGRLWTIVCAYAIAIAVQLATTLLLVGSMGAEGAAIGRTSSHLVLSALLLASIRLSGVRLPLQSFARHALATAAMAACILAAGSPPLWITLPLGAVAYAVALALLLPAGSLERSVIEAWASRFAPRPPGGPRRVLFVEANEDGTVGGSHRALVDLVAHLDRRRWTPVVLAYQTNALLASTGVETHFWDDVRAEERRHLGPGGLAKRVRAGVPAVRRRVAFLRAQRIDVVHLNNTPAVGYEDWLPAARLARVACVAHVRGEFWRSRRWLGRLLTRRFDAVIAVSAAMAQFAREAGIPASRLHVVHDGVDEAALRRRIVRSRDQVRRELGVPEDRLLVVMVGHLRRWKGHALVLEALRIGGEALQRRIVLAFVGGVPSDDPAHAEQLKEIAARARLEGVHFLGERRDAAEILAACDVALHASTSPEPFGLVLVEAMMLGRPVIASRLGGPLEIVTGETGLLFDPRRPEELAALLARLTRDTALRERIGAAGRARAAEFRIERTVRAIEAVYERVLARAPASDLARAPEHAG